ncbi:MAG: M28 family peptidase [Armatimonadota bacterium]
MKESITKRTFLLALATTALFGFTAPQSTSLSYEAATKNATVISGETLKDYLTFIAADALMGRDTPSPGLDAAANFIAFNLKSWGAKPGGDNGTYFQNIQLERVYLNKTSTQISAGEVTLALGKDFMVNARKFVSGRVAGPLETITKKSDQYDVRGKIVLLGASLGSEIDQIVKSGALAVIISAESSSTTLNQNEPGLRPAAGHAVDAPMPTPIITASINAFQRLTSLSDTKALITLATNRDIQMTRNIVAIAEGSDPKLKAEYVAVGAHYDHVGFDPNLPGPDKIYNGADDDGSGTVSVMNIAKAFLTSSARPKRSILFVWHCGEEKGLWGSDYYNSHLTVPKGSIVAQLNIDMIGRSRKAGDTDPRNKSLTGPNAVYVIGTTMMSTRLGEIVHAVNGKYLKLDYDKLYDDPKDPNQFFYRSDHYNYAKNGIPICFWFDGEHEDYHQVGDEVSKIDFNKMERIARTVYLTGVTVANEPVRPPVDKKLGR